MGKIISVGEGRISRSDCYSGSELNAALGFQISGARLVSIGLEPDARTDLGLFWKKDRLDEIRRAIASSILGYVGDTPKRGDISSGSQSVKPMSGHGSVRIGSEEFDVICNTEISNGIESIVAKRVDSRSAIEFVCMADGSMCISVMSDWGATSKARKMALQGAYAIECLAMGGKIIQDGEEISQPDFKVYD